LTNVLIVGVGNIGGRHLQSLALINEEITIWIVEPDNNSIEKAKKLFGTMPPNKNITSLKYFDSLNRINENIDIAIIATKSDIRRAIIEDMLELINVKYVIMEKVLFQKIQDYHHISNLFKQKNIKGWVNCPLRTFDIYKEIKNNVKDTQIVAINVTGGSNIGLGCNSIHYLDLASYFGSSVNYRIKKNSIDLEIVNSKRNDFIEFVGSYGVEFDNGLVLTLKSYEELYIPPMVQIISENVIYTINEISHECITCDVKSNWGMKIENIKWPFQSSRTHKVIEDLIQNGDTELIAFEDSIKIHLPMITAFINTLNDLSDNYFDYCPVT